MTFPLEFPRMLSGTVRLLITGGRTFAIPAVGKIPSRVREERDCVYGVMEAVRTWCEAGPETGRKLVIVHGGAPGADCTAGLWVVQKTEHPWVTTEVHWADWRKHGKAAGPIRNQAMLDSKPDLCIAFPGGRGTNDMVSRCLSRKTPTLGVKIAYGSGWKLEKLR